MRSGALISLNGLRTRGEAGDYGKARRGYANQRRRSYRPGMRFSLNPLYH
jgi:hypothetical protein